MRVKNNVPLPVQFLPIVCWFNYLICICWLSISSSVKSHPWLGCLLQEQLAWYSDRWRQKLAHWLMKTKAGTVTDEEKLAQQQWVTERDGGGGCEGGEGELSLYTLPLPGHLHGEGSAMSAAGQDKWTGHGSHTSHSVGCACAHLVDLIILGHLNWVEPRKNLITYSW